MIPTIEIVPPAPTTEPVSVTEFKQHIRTNTTAEDTLLAGFIAAAREQFEFMTDGRICASTTFREHFLTWGKRMYPGRHYYWPGYLELGRAPVTEVVSVKYLDTDGVEQTLTGWEADFTGTPAIVYLPDKDYPAYSTTTYRPITVEYEAGFTTVPQDVKLGITLLAAYFFMQRESHSTEDIKDVPLGFTHLCRKYNTGLGGF